MIHAVIGSFLQLIFRLATKGRQHNHPGVKLSRAWGKLRQLLWYERIVRIVVQSCPDLTNTICISEVTLGQKLSYWQGQQVKTKGKKTQKKKKTNVAITSKDC